MLRDDAGHGVTQTIRIRSDGHGRIAGAEVKLVAPERLGDGFAHELPQINLVGPESQVTPLQVADGQ